jgi:hypothetical protein
MTKPTKDSRITSSTVEAAKRDADAGLDWQHPDPECKGLSLRVRGRGVSWTFRGPRLAGKNRRWTLGDHRVSPKQARQRAWAVRGRIQKGLDPTSLVTALVTGVDEQQQLDLRVEAQPSWEWSDAIDRFLTDIIGTTRQPTRDDYRGTLKNTPELQIFCGRQVCDIVREEIAEAVEKVRRRGVKTHHKKVLITCRRFFNWLGSDARRRETSVPANFLLGAKAGAAERDVPGRRVVNKGIPETNAIGRALAIARAGVLGTLPSLGIQMVLGTVSRRRGVVGLRSQDYESYRPGIYVWFQPPAFRKTADKIQSSAAHQVPLVGWAATVVDILERRLRRDDTAGWLFPVARPRHAGVEPKTPHMNTGTLNHNMDAMPGVYGQLSPHRLRVAFGSYGKKFGGFADGEAKLILDHTEGVGDDVTRGHYDLDPRIERKIEMMTWWTQWLDEQCAAAIAADSMLLDKDALRQACYIERYGQQRWEAKLAKAKEGAPLWPVEDQEVSVLPAE